MRSKIGAKTLTVTIAIATMFAITFILNHKVNPPINAQSTTTTIKPIADTHVKKNYPNKNYGSNVAIISDGNPLVESYLQFDLSAINKDRVTKAELQIPVALTRVVNKTIRISWDNWQEDKLTWNNKTQQKETVAIVDQTVNKSDVVTINITNLVRNSDNNIFTLVITDEVKGYQLVSSSKESGTPITLTFSQVGNYSQIPGDIDGNNQVDDYDLKLIYKNMNKTVTLGAAAGDFNEDQVVDANDLLILFANYGEKGVTPSPTGIPSPTQVPQPSLGPTPTTPPVPTSTPVVTITPIPTPPPAQVTNGIWINQSELSSLPTQGVAWDRLKNAADSNWGTANISNQDSHHDTYTLAGALVYARTGNSIYREKTANAIFSAIETENGGRTLALGRNLLSYVLAAELIDYKNYRPSQEVSFRQWLNSVRFENLEGRTLISTHEVRPNNWGTHAGASRIAAALYLNDTADLQKAADVHKGWLGNTSSYSGFDYGESYWQSNPNNPVGINPKNATLLINGALRDVDGVLPDDQRRCGSPTWPPCKENYVWEALQGAVVSTEMLYRAGYDVYNWEDQAILRAIQWLHKPHFAGNSTFPAEGDDRGIPFIINKRYSTSFPAVSTSSYYVAKNIGWTDWTHQ